MLFSVSKADPTKNTFRHQQSQPQMLFSNASKYFGFLYLILFFFSSPLAAFTATAQSKGESFEKWYFDFLNNGNYVWHNLVKGSRQACLLLMLNEASSFNWWMLECLTGYAPNELLSKYIQRFGKNWTPGARNWKVFNSLKKRPSPFDSRAQTDSEVNETKLIVLRSKREWKGKFLQPHQCQVTINYNFDRVPYSRRTKPVPGIPNK